MINANANVLISQAIDIRWICAVIEVSTGRDLLTDELVDSEKPWGRDFRTWKKGPGIVNNRTEAEAYDHLAKHLFDTSLRQK